MKPIDYEVVKKQIDNWSGCYANNNTRGVKYIRFALGDQWQNGSPEKRRGQNKETLVFNLTKKELNRMKAQARDTEFTLDLVPTNNESLDNVQETNSFKLLLQNIILSSDVTDKITEAYDKCLDFGYSFVEVSFCKESRDKLSKVPTLINHKDPRTAFWDLNAAHPCMIDGMYAGISKKNLSKKDVMLLLPNLRDKSMAYEGTNNHVVLYYFRVYEDADFVLLNTGEYKQKDKLSIFDMNNLATKEIEFDGDVMPLEIRDKVSSIYYQVFLNERVAVKPQRYPLDDFMPVVKHPSLSQWYPDKADFTIPFIYDLDGAQQLHNYTNSQIATMAKNSTSDKWIFNTDHVLTQVQKNNAREINTKEGGLTFGGDTSTIRRERSAEIPMSLIQQSQLAKQEIEEISGAMMNIKDSQKEVVSGVALDKITHAQQMINVNIQGRHILFVNTICSLFRQMIPKLITEERIITIKKKDGSAEVMCVNKYVESTGAIINNIKDINNNFQYNIKAGPTSTMQRENTVRYLTQIYQLNPAFFEDTKDIYMRLLQSSEAGELERRALAKMDPNYIKFSQGEISYDEYVQHVQESQKMQLQQQAEMAKLSPESQIAEAEKTKAMVGAQKAKSEAMVSMQKAKAEFIERMGRVQNENDKVRMQLIELMAKIGDTQIVREIDKVKTFIDVNSKIIDHYRNAALDQEAQQNQQQQQQLAQAEGMNNAEG